MPDADAGAGARVALIDARDARGRRALALAAGELPGNRAALDAVDLDGHVWFGNKAPSGKDGNRWLPSWR